MRNVSNANYVVYMFTYVEVLGLPFAWFSDNQDLKYLSFLYLPVVFIYDFLNEIHSKLPFYM